MSIGRQCLRFDRCALECHSRPQDWVLKLLYMNLLQRILQSKFLERLKRRIGIASGLHLRLKRFTPSASEPMRIAMLAVHKRIDLVIDVGANTGQFAESLYDFGFTGKVISFEPVKAAHDELTKRSRRYPQWIVASRCAIGHTNGEIEINVSDDTVFSSVLEIREQYVAHNPKSRITRKERIPVYCLDNILKEYALEKTPRILLKIDTQGYEKQVLEGARETLAKVIGLKIEIPLYPIYHDNDFTFYDILDFVKRHGFQPYSFHIEGVDLNTGRVNTIDGLFFKED